MPASMQGFVRAEAHAAKLRGAEAHLLELGAGRRTDPEEAQHVERAAQHVAQHGREAAVGAEVGEEAGALPVRHACPFACAPLVTNLLTYSVCAPHKLMVTLSRTSPPFANMYMHRYHA